MLKRKLISRVDKNRDYTPIINAVFKDKRISWGAKGIMGYALTKPDDWSLHISDVVNQGVDGKSKVTAYFKELRCAGYFEYTRVYEYGKIVAAVYTISEHPKHMNDFTIETEHERRVKKKLKPDSPVLGTPALGTPAVANRILLSTELLSTDSVQNTEKLNTEEEEALPKNEIEKEVVSELRKSIEKNSSSSKSRYLPKIQIKLIDLLAKHSKQELLAAANKLNKHPKFKHWSFGGVVQFIPDILNKETKEQDSVVNKLFTNPHHRSQFDGHACTSMPEGWAKR